MGRYQFNEERLEFTKVRLSIRKILLRGLGILACSVLVAVVYYLLFGLFLKSPAERNLERETQIMNDEYARLSKEMESLDKVISELETRDRNIYGTVLHSTPLDLEEKETAVSRYQLLAEEGDFELVHRSDSAITSLEHRSAAVTRALYRAELLAYAKRDSLAYIPACFPLKRPTMESIGATIGQRIHPFYKIPMEHNGMDFLVGLGTDVIATADGVVKKVDRSQRGQGNRIEIAHPYGNYATIYAHLSEVFVRAGQPVKRGMVIARVGSSGMSFTPHLHYEVHMGDVVQDPVHYFIMNVTPASYRQVMMLAYNMGQSLD